MEIYKLFGIIAALISEEAAMMLLKVVALVACCLLSEGSLTFSNVAARRDVNGVIMDAHDGSYRQFDVNGSKLWYYYAMGYGLCTENGKSASQCGTGRNNTVNLWTSPNLVDWTFAAEVLPMISRPDCVYYRSHAVYNKNTQKYVLVVNVQKCDSFCGEGSYSLLSHCHERSS